MRTNKNARESAITILAGGVFMSSMGGDAPIDGDRGRRARAALTAPLEEKP